MITRRGLILSVTAALAVAMPAAAQSNWQQRFPELVFAVVPAENATGVTERFQPFIDYLARELGVRVTLRIANDYAAVIEGHRAGNIHIGGLGPSSYVRAWTVTNGGVEPFVTTINADGSTGYYSVLYVRANNPANSLQDLRGRNLCLVDPNSTSGNNVPRFAMDKMGINPEQFFGRVVFAGSHENAVMAVLQGTCDAAFNWWNSEDDSNLSRMANRGMVRREDFKIVFRSDMIPGSPYAFITALPQEARAAIRQAFLDAPTKARAAFDRLSDGKDRGFHPVQHSDFQVIVDLQRFVDQLRRRGS
jgi:phosphonate transport system substrate-binding protein